MDRYNWKRVISIIARINIKYSANIFAKVSGYSARTLEPNKEEKISTKITIPTTMESRNTETNIVFETVVGM